VFAEKTKQIAISLTNEWNAKYGAVYKQVALGYEFLRYHLKIDFTNLVPVTEEARGAEKRAQEEMTRRLRQKKYEKAAEEMNEVADSIQENIRNMNSCFEILVPNLDDEAALNAIFNDAAKDMDMEEEDLQDDLAEKEETGESSMASGDDILAYDPLGVHDNALGSTRYKLTIQVNKDNPVDVTETEGNSELYATLRESYRLIVKKHWPIVTEWLDALMKADHGGEQRAEYDRLLKLAIDLKRGVADAKSKSEDLGINMETMYGPDEHDSDEEDEEFEEVDVLAPKDKKKGKDKGITDTQRMTTRKPKNPVFAMHGAQILEDDPTYAGVIVPPSRRAAESESEPKDSLLSDTQVSISSAETEREMREDLLSRAPVVPWDDDLAMWDKKEFAFNTSGLEYSHRFLGVGDGSNMVSQATLDRMKMRTRVYSPQLPKVIKACRYPMSNGRLCMRRDLVRCPYHGPIVPRDERGQVQRTSEGGGFVPEEDGLDDEQEAELINRALKAASGSTTRSSTRLIKDKTTWEDIEDDVNLALGLEKIEPKRKRGQGAESSKRKRAQKATSALINISKPAETSKTRLLKHLGTKAVKDAVEQDRRSARAEMTKDARAHRW
ncbi:hypothetical protein BGX31_002909, partial [Mortierella sp. GBA43]